MSDEPGPVLLNVSAKTQQGHGKATNEDSILAGPLLSAGGFCHLCSAEFTHKAPFVVAVADGVGGHRAGAAASSLCVEMIASATGALADADSVAGLLCQINNRVYETMGETAGTVGMGTTVAGVVLTLESAIVFNVGDSRVYRLQYGHIRQLSTDDRRLDGLSRLPVLSQCIGGRSERVPIEPHLDVRSVHRGASYLVCSDGLSDVLNESAIERMMQDKGKAASPAERLVKTAIAMGSRDDVSAIVVEVR